MKRQLSNGVFQVCPHCDRAMAQMWDNGRGIRWFCIFCEIYVNEAMKYSRCNTIIMHDQVIGKKYDKDLASEIYARLTWRES